MEEEQDKSYINTIYWVVTITPLILLNITPYLGFSLPETVDNDETYRQLIYGFSLAFVLLLVSTFSSIKCIMISKTMMGKIFAALFLLLYSLLIFAMLYFYLSGYIN